MNQRHKASQEPTASQNLMDMAGLAARTCALVQGTPWPVGSAGPEVTAKACGVTATMLQGHSWAPNPSNGQK